MGHTIYAWHLQNHLEGWSVWIIEFTTICLAETGKTTAIRCIDVRETGVCFFFIMVVQLRVSLKPHWASKNYCIEWFKRRPLIIDSYTFDGCWFYSLLSSLIQFQTEPGQRILCIYSSFMNAGKINCKLTKQNGEKIFIYIYVYNVDSDTQDHIYIYFFFDAECR